MKDKAWACRVREVVIIYEKIPVGLTTLEVRNAELLQAPWKFPQLTLAQGEDVKGQDLRI